MKPEVEVREHQDGTRVRVRVGSAEVWVRATPGGRRLEVSVDEGRGEVDVEWCVRRVHANVLPNVTGPYIQSPPYDRREPVLPVRTPDGVRRHVDQCALSPDHTGPCMWSGGGYGVAEWCLVASEGELRSR